ncbi:MAG: PhoH family protein [Burkholderiaceae bacterium]|nr:PhoH family protein [Burkholderiaceae bacterium]
MPLPKAPSKPADIVNLRETQQVSSRRSASLVSIPQALPQEKVSAPTAQTVAKHPGKSSLTPLMTVSTTLRRGTAKIHTAVEKLEPTTEQPPQARVPLQSIQKHLPADLRPSSVKKASKASKNNALTKKLQEKPKLFVIDTNVLLHDPVSLFRFEEHDLFLPMITLEELDNNKKGMTEVARNARTVSRNLDQLASKLQGPIEEGILLSLLGNKEATGRLIFQTRALDNSALPASLPMGKADNQILGVVRALTDSYPNRTVVLVSKDINMRVKARALGLLAEDYFSDKVLEDKDILYTGVLALPQDFWDKHSKGIESWQHAGSTFYRITGPMVPSMLNNQFVYFEGLEGATPSLYAQVKEIHGRTALLQTLKDFTHAKNAVWGITARNREQNFALNLLMNPEVDFVSLLGQAGTGKTLITLAAALAQCLDKKLYTEIIMTRATVPVGEDIGFLPGTEEEKMAPWMGAVEDNLEVLLSGGSQNGSNNTHGAGEWGRQATTEFIKSKIKIKSMNFMRGRTFLNKIVILDEAQNLTPKQMKTLITRAGPGTKIICMGNIAQIDTPYLTEGSSGLTFVVDRFKGWPHSGHVTLARGERSRLADFAAEAL